MAFRLGHELYLDEGKRRALFDMRLDLGAASRAVDVHGFFLLACLHMNIRCLDACKPFRKDGAVDAEPAPCAHGYGAENFLILHVSSSLPHRAFQLDVDEIVHSKGSSFAIGSTKPRTIIARASSSSMPRLVR